MNNRVVLEETSVQFKVRVYALALKLPNKHGMKSTSNSKSIKTKETKGLERDIEGPST